MSDAVNRRDFFRIGATAAGGVLLVSQLGRTPCVLAGPAEDGWPKLEPAEIHTVYVGRTGGIYLSRPTEEVERFENYLAEIEKKLGDVQFTGSDFVPVEDVAPVLERVKQADAVLMFHLSGHGGGAPRTAMDQVIDAGKPTVIFSQPFSGHGWMYLPVYQKAGKPVVLLPTSDWSELEQAARLLRVPAKMRQSKILCVGNPKGTAPSCQAEAIRERLGSEMVLVDNQQIIDAHGAVPLDEAEAEAEKYWLSQAQRVLEPTREEIISSARLYLAVKRLMIEERAQAITSSHCMGAPAKGCLTFSKLCDQGLVGACEGDMDSTLTMLMFNYAFDVPGFISDPVIDTARNALVHFHCTSATKMDGPQGERLPFTIRTQSDSERGVSLEVANRMGQEVTCAKFINLDTMLISTGKIIDVTRDELGCRTQFWTEVADARSMFTNWGGGVLEGDVMTMLHRVVFYGDHSRNVEHLGHLMGFRVVAEA